jgi:sodium/potassium-transporting ATPase subunit alpha
VIWDQLVQHILTLCIFFSVAFNFAVGILLAWVPQGLPATVNMLLSVAAQRMAKQNVIVKDLNSVETLGSITLLATDKTGTLTRNHMSVANVWTQARMFTVSMDPSALQQGEIPLDLESSGVQDILRISALCSKARFDANHVSMSKRTIIGDATETGLLHFSMKNLIDLDSFFVVFPKVFEIPFNSENKWHLSVHRMPHSSGDYVVLMKGAPERVWEMCSTMLAEDGRLCSLGLDQKKSISASYEYLAAKGHRVLAFAKLELPANPFSDNFSFQKTNIPMENLIFLGLVSLEDPPKKGVREAVGHCRRAGIKVVMVTGDHPLTAEAIARRINIMVSDTKATLAKKHGVAEKAVNDQHVKAIVVNGEQIGLLSDEEWEAIFSKDEIIFARTSPVQKLQIVKRAQSLGHIVAVTGDGVNDAPALKIADIGIAMNKSGSDVSKDAASMILLDDNFTSIVPGIREGRMIFINLKKSVQYLLSHTLPEVIPQILYVLIPLPLGINAIQILAIDLGFELFAALSFAFEPSETTGIMKLPPRKSANVGTSLFHGKKGNSDKVEYVKSVAQTSKTSFLSPVLGYFTPTPKPFQSQDDSLVDLRLISWSYLEIGLLQYIGAQISFFLVMYMYQDFKVTPADASTCMIQTNGTFASTGAPNCVLSPQRIISWQNQTEMLKQAQSAWYLSILIMQMWNLIACKSLLVSPISKRVFENKQTWIAMFGGIFFALMIIYVPSIANAVGCSSNLDPRIPLAISISTGVLILVYGSLRFLVLNRMKPYVYVPEPSKMQMHPTQGRSKP